MSAKRLSPGVLLLCPPGLNWPKFNLMLIPKPISGERNGCPVTRFAPEVGAGSPFARACRGAGLHTQAKLGFLSQEKGAAGVSAAFATCGEGAVNTRAGPQLTVTVPGVAGGNGAFSQKTAVVHSGSGVFSVEKAAAL